MDRNRIHHEHGLFGLLDENLLLKILERISDRSDRQAWCLVCTRFLQLEASCRQKLQLVRAEVLESVLGRYNAVQELDLSLCLQVTNESLATVGSLSGLRLRTIDLSRQSRLSEAGLSALVDGCSLLQEIDLSYSSDICDLAIIAISKLKELRTLKLVNCRTVSDAGLGCLAAGCKNLSFLSLKWCLGITDTGISFIADNCTKLHTLDLSYTQVSSLGLEAITRIESLRNLMLVSCTSVDDDGLARLRNGCRSLEGLDVARCINLSDRGILALASGPLALTQLTLSYCLPVTDVLLASLEKFHTLQSIKLDGCEIAGSGLAFIGRGCKMLKEFSASKCNGVTDDGICDLVFGCKDLHRLNLTCCRELTDLSLAAIATSCKGLLSLQMEACRLVTSQGIALLGNCCCNLEELDFTDSSANDEGLKSLSRCTALRSLKLGYCLGITDRGVENIGTSCYNLRELDLYRSVGIGDPGIIAVANGCPRLRILNMSYCRNITDKALRAVSQLTDLHQLELRACVLVSSKGVESIAACKRLEEVDLKKCYNIGGSGIKALVEGCPNIRELNVSYCRISNKEMMHLAKLSCLNNFKVVHLKGVDFDVIASALLLLGSLKKVKLLSSMQMQISKEVIEILETRGCKLRWMSKPDFPELESLE